MLIPFAKKQNFLVAYERKHVILDQLTTLNKDKIIPFIYTECSEQLGPKVLLLYSDFCILWMLLCSVL